MNPNSFSIKKAFSFAWNTLFSNLKVLLGSFVLLILLPHSLNFIISFFSSSLEGELFVAVSLAQELLIILMGIFLFLGFTRILLNIHDGIESKIRMMLSQGSCFLRALGVQFFLTLAMLLPLALLLGSIYLYTLKMEESLIESYLMILTIIIMLVASFYCAIYQQLILFFLVDKKETLLVTTRKVMNFTKGVKLRLLLFFLLNTMVLLSGFILFGIGVLLTVQLNALAMTSVYKQLSVEHAVEQEEESHPQ